MMEAAADVLTASMVSIPGGKFIMGSNDHYPEEAPAHERTAEAFLMDVFPVTNSQFAVFAEATGYVTTAERRPSPADYPGVASAALIAGSAVFCPPDGPVDLSWPSWWEYRAGACWHAPQGPGSRIADRLEHPVVHVSYEDATTYAAWCGKRLPTETEWEFAARGGLHARAYAWGDDEHPGGQVMANIWAGEFPNCSDPGAARGTTQVGRFPANGFGLYDITGNVWEWTQDWFAHGHRVHGCCASNAEHNARPVSDPFQVGGGLRVVKGGSFLCARNYCARYRPAARIPQAQDSSASNIGFRCVVTASSDDRNAATVHRPHNHRIADGRAVVRNNQKGKSS